MYSQKGLEMVRVFNADRSKLIAEHDTLAAALAVTVRGGYRTDIVFDLAEKWLIVFVTDHTGTDRSMIECNTGDRVI